MLALRRKVNGPEHPDTLHGDEQPGDFLLRPGRRDEALKLREEVLALRRKVLGPEHPDTLMAMDNLADSYADAGRRDEALKLREEVLPLRRKVSGPEHPDTLTAMNNLAVSYVDAGRRDEALKLLEEVLRARRKVLGPEHPDTLGAMNNLAVSYFDAGRRDEALKLREEVLALRRKVLGPEHPDTLKAMRNLAISYATPAARTRRSSCGRRCWRSAARCSVRSTPTRSARCRAWRVSYLKCDRRDEALKMREEVLPLRRKVNGPEHPDTLAAMHNLADSYFEAVRGDGSPRLRDKALPLLAEVSTSDPAETALAMKLAALQVWFGKEADHTATSRRMLQWASDQEGPDPADRAAKITNLRPPSDLQMQQASLALARRAVELGQTNSLLPWYQLGLGMAEYRNSNYLAADRMLRAAELPGQNTWRPEIRVGTAKFYRAMSLFRQGQGSEARQLFTEAEATMKPLPAADHWPLTDGADHDDLILWLACREAKAVLTPSQASSP